MDKDNFITWLNAQLPPLARWHEWLLAAALVVAVVSTLELYRSGWYAWGVVPGLVWLRLLWRRVPPASWARWKWALVTGTWGLVVASIVFIGIVRLF